MPIPDVRPEEDTEVEESEEPDRPAQLESLCDGRFILFGLLGTGSQGSTFDAVDRLHGRPVAIKRFDIGGAQSWKDVELAEREASVLASLAHPNLPAYVHHFEEGGRLYLAMEKVEGTSLARVMTGEARLSPQQMMDLAETLGGLLLYLQSRIPPVVHRDIKPSNIILDRRGSFSLVDFGSVRDGLLPEGGSTVVGTYGYMAPEQFQGRALPATDVYGVGVTLLSLITRTTPDKLPHRGLQLDVGAALGKQAHPAWVTFLSQLVEADPDRRASNILPLLATLRQQLGAVPHASASHPPPPHVQPPHPHVQPPPPPRTASAWPSPPRATEGVPEFPGFLFLPLLVVRIALFAILEVALPILLNVLSIVFGERLRTAGSLLVERSYRARKQIAQMTQRSGTCVPPVTPRFPPPPRPYRKKHQRRRGWQ